MDQLDGGYRHALKEVACVASKEPSDLVAFVSRRDGIGDDEVTVDNLRMHCQDRLSPAYVPKFFVIMPDLPHLSNGKTNLAVLKEEANRTVSEEGEMVLDSLGQMKKLSKWAIYENAVIHRCYAYWMIGVLFDHFFRCALDSGPDGSFIPYCTVLCQKAVRPWSEVLIRSFGNDQDLFGFILLGAYQDSRPAVENGPPKVKLGGKDLFLFAVYMMLALPMPQIFNFLTVNLAWPIYWGEPCIAWSDPAQQDCIKWGPYSAAPANNWNWDYMQYNSFTSDHRWYLIMVLQARCYLQLCEFCRVPGWLQGIIISIPCFLPNSIFEGTEYAFDVCENNASPVYVMYMFSWVARNFGDGCALYWRWCHWYTAAYVWCFHFLRPFVRRATPLLPVGAVWSAIALSISMTIGVLMAMFHYPNNVLENGTGMQYAPLELGVDMIQPMLFALGMVHLPLNLSWWGNTTLGCYAFHFYFKDSVGNFIRESVAPSMAWDGSGILMFLIALCICAVFTTFLGPIGHAFLVLPHVMPGRIRKLSEWYQRQQQAREVRTEQAAVCTPESQLQP